MNGMKPYILVIDGQGGSIGLRLVKLLRERLPDAEIMAVGTNSAASVNMLKSGASAAATGENAVITACRKADIITGPVGIAIADALYGEVTPAMAAAVGSSAAVRVLIPFNRCDTVIAGTEDIPSSRLIDSAAEKITALLSNS